MDDNFEWLIIGMFFVVFVFGFYTGGCANDVQWRKDLVDNPTYVNAVTAEENAKREGVKARDDKRRRR